MPRATENAQPVGGARSTRGMETYYGHVRTPADAILLFEACRLGVLPRVQRRLSEKERAMIRSGSVFVWDEREAGMRRWTDGKSWSASRVSGSFLTYREMEGKRAGGGRRSEGSPSPGEDGSADDRDFEDEGDGYRYKPDGLMKHSFSITTSTHQKLHLISYYARSQHQAGGLVQPTTDQHLKHIHPPKGMYPDATSEEHAALVAQQGPRAVPYQHSAPANHYSRQVHNHTHQPPQHYSPHYYQPYPPPTSRQGPPSSHYPYEYPNGGPPPHPEHRTPYNYPSPVATPPTSYASHGAPPPQHAPPTLAPIHPSSMPTSPRRSSSSHVPTNAARSSQSSPSMTHHHSPNSRYHNSAPYPPPPSSGPYPRVPTPHSEQRNYEEYQNGSAYRAGEIPPPAEPEQLQDSAIQTCMRWDDNRMKDSFRLVL
jgi:Gti1/Pac2 family transcription factor